MTNIIIAENLTKSYRSKKAVDALTLHIKKGEFFGFFGPNGAGKTTTIRLLTGILKPDQGEVMAVGNGKILEDGKVRPLDVKVGDRILFGKYSGSEIKVEGIEYFIMKEDDVLGLVES